jgi:hypothetical protein
VEFSPRPAAPRFQIDSSDAFYPPLWEDDWKSRGIGVGHTVPETDYSLGGSVVLVNVVRGTTSSHITEVASPIPFDYACPSEDISHVHWSGWSMGRNQLISVCKSKGCRVGSSWWSRC